ncbi:hypothetical protein C8R44DRAFT_752561 [Mycena epipterygia]|nr:hypothetical protein C8R44DRAFT_752561 [Mycena epipterygia]
MSDYVPYSDPLLPSSQTGSDYEQLESQHEEIERTEKRRMYRAAAVEDESSTSRELPAHPPAYQPRGPLDWQTTSQEFVDALLSAQLADQEDRRKGRNVIDSQTTSQDFAGLLFHQRPPVVHAKPQVCGRSSDGATIESEDMEVDAKRGYGGRNVVGHVEISRIKAGEHMPPVKPPVPKWVTVGNRWATGVQPSQWRLHFDRYGNCPQCVGEARDAIISSAHRAGFLARRRRSQVAYQWSRKGELRSEFGFSNYGQGLNPSEEAGNGFKDADFHGHGSVLPGIAQWHRVRDGFFLLVRRRE